MDSKTAALPEAIIAAWADDQPLSAETLRDVVKLGDSSPAYITGEQWAVSAMIRLRRAAYVQQQAEADKAELRGKMLAEIDGLERACRFALDRVKQNPEAAEFALRHAALASAAAMRRYVEEIMR